MYPYKNIYVYLRMSAHPPFSVNTGVHIDYNVDKISYDDFINRELILFSHAGDVEGGEN